MNSRPALNTTESDSTSSVRVRLAWPVGAVCVLLAVGLGGVRTGAFGANSYLTPYWSVPADQAPLFLAESNSTDLMMSDAQFAAQGWRWSPGTCAWIAVLVRVDALRSVALARIGGLYGP